MCICYTHIRFMKALKAQGMSRDDLPYKAPFQPWGSWFAIVATGIITIFKGTSSLSRQPVVVCLILCITGFDTFIPFTKDTFVTSYIALPTLVIFYSTYKIYYRSTLIPSDKVDLITGKREIDEEEERFNKEQEMRGPRTRWQRLWDSL